jgi:hypothetical protein
MARPPRERLAACTTGRIRVSTEGAEVAVRRCSFAERVQDELGILARHRSVVDLDAVSILRDPEGTYELTFGIEMGPRSPV